MSRQLVRKHLGEMPLLQTMIRNLRFREVLQGYVKAHGNETIGAVDTLLLMVCNITCGRQPLYELPEWIDRLEHRSLGEIDTDGCLFNDDRFGRALDKLFEADRASLVIDIVLWVIETTGVDVSQIHNDSTTVKTTGQMPRKTPTGLQFKHGHSKDHRPDLKQIVYNLTISADGAIPLHYKAYPGNRTDDTLHIEIWNTLSQITGRDDFLYVADSKVCTHKQLDHIVRYGGRVVTLMPQTWKEADLFKQAQRQSPRKKARILRRLLPNSEKKYETFYRLVGNDHTVQGHYPLHWIYSTEKKKRDQGAREKQLKKAEADLSELMIKLNMRQLKTRAQIEQRVEKLLHSHGVESFYHIDIGEVEEEIHKQIGRGRPTKNTRYETLINTIYTLSWRRNNTTLQRESHLDGIFPILCTDKTLTAKAALEAYKYQPRLEKRFYQLKTVHLAAPTLFKKIERVEAMMLLFFLALILQAVIEREVRKQMNALKIKALSIYPEHRLAYHPTTAKIFDRFHDISTYQIRTNDQVVEEYHDDLTELQKEILALLGMTEQDYWHGVM